MNVEYSSYIRSNHMNPLIYDIINNSVSMNRSGNDSLLSQERWTRPLYIYALFIALIILSLSLNAVVIIVCIRASIRKHPVILYFLNLAIGDSGIALSMILYLHNMDIPWTDATCKLVVFIQTFTTIFSLNTLLLVAIERFIAVRIPTKFQAFTTLRCILRQLCGLWLISAVMVIYPTLGNTVKLNNGCFGQMSEYELALIAPLPILMLVLYISILSKLRQRQRRSRSPKISSAKHLRETNDNPEYSCEASLKTMNDVHVSEDFGNDSNDIVKFDNLYNDQEICNSDINASDMQDATKPVFQCNIPSINRLSTERIASSNNPDLLDDSKFRENVESDIQPTRLSLTHPSVLTIEHSTDTSMKRWNKLNKVIDSSPKQKKRTTVDQRNKKAIRLVLAIFLIMILCHTGLLYTIVYASINNIGQEYIYSVGDIVAIPYVIHTCITPVLQLKFNDLVRQGLPARFHQSCSA